MAAVAALAVGLTGVTGSAHRVGTIRTAAFTLVSHSDGTATLTANPLVLLDPDRQFAVFLALACPVRAAESRALPGGHVA